MNEWISLEDFRRWYLTNNITILMKELILS